MHSQDNIPNTEAILCFVAHLLHVRGKSRFLAEVRELFWVDPSAEGSLLSANTVNVCRETLKRML